MKPHPSIRKFFKWGGVLVSVLMVAVWGGSSYGWFFSSSQDGISLEVLRGQVSCMFFQDGHQAHRTWTEWIRASPGGFNWSAKYEKTADSWHVLVPLWPFVLISVATTAAAWRMDTLARRRKLLGGCPACGYNRAGLAAGAPCPECSAKA